MTSDTLTDLRILVADDHAMVLEMFQQFLSSQANMEAVTAPDLDAALACMDNEGPFDLALVDLNMPGMDGTSGLRKAMEHNKGKPVALLTSNPSPDVVADVLQLGAAGIVLKTTSLKDLANEVRFMIAGGRYIPVELIETGPIRTRTREATNSPLSAREMTVLNLLGEGRSNREIGAALTLAEATVKMHVKSICSKLGASNRTQAVIVAQDMGLI
ncbi:response regulator transcription factor [Oceanicola sp. S124]|uniref:response regulator transcription factor n=1 Tax=Oceanicola sp. S124 TaxID=1042378 RepID=UPI000255972B|nr:response regulator transcription factor [Oceanicola sp. S124]